MLKGIDVSEHQGRIDWDRVKDKIDFAIIREGWGSHTTDSQADRNVRECNRLGIPVGLYHFSYAYTIDMAIHEAHLCIEFAKKYRIDYPIVYDLERASLDYAKKVGKPISRRLATDMAKAFMREVEKAGYYAMLYTNPDLLNNVYYKDELIPRFALWLAWYKASISSAKKYAPKIFQYSEEGTISGIGTHSVDLDYGFEDMAETIRRKGLNHLDGSKPTYHKPSGPSYKLVPQHGTCTIVVDKLNIREKPSTNSDVVGSYSKDETVQYDYYVDSEGYRWISWIGASGKRRYMAVRVLSTNKRYGHCV